MQTPGPTPAHHWTLLLLGLAVPLAAALLDVTDSESVAVRGWPQYPLPQVCASRSLFGWDCPACGLTRSTIHLVHGEWRESWAHHRLGGLFLLLFVTQVPYRIWRLSGGAPIPTPALLRGVAPWIFLGGLLLLNRLIDWL